MNFVIVYNLKNRCRCCFVALLFFLLSFKSNAQQLPNYTQYLYNMQIINPAYVGVRSDLSISLLSREQWVGIEGAPKTKTFSINGRTSNGLGIGATVVNDKIGFSETTNVNFDASYTLLTSRYTRLSLGLKGGLTFFNNNFSNAITPDNDIYASNSGQFTNVGLGALFYSKKFFIGFSVPYLFETPQFYIESNFKNFNKIDANANYFLSAGIVINLSENILFKPSTIIRQSSNLPTSYDLNANFLFKEVIETGVSYRNQNSLSALFALIVKKKFRVGYSYDYKISNEIGNFNTHEIILHLDLNFKRNSRWLEANKCYF